MDTSAFVRYALTQDRLASVLGDRARVIAALESSFQASAKSPLVVLCAHRIARLLGCDLGIPAVTEDLGAAGDACVAFAEQWIIDVASMTPELVCQVTTHLGEDGLMDFVHSLLIIEQRVRLELAWQRLGLLPVVEQTEHRNDALTRWGSTGPVVAIASSAPKSSRRGPGHDVPARQGERRVGRGRHGDAALAAVLSEWQAAVVCLDQVDAITTELVRLRCANYHDCHT